MYLAGSQRNTLVNTSSIRFIMNALKFSLHFPLSVSIIFIFPRSRGQVAALNKLFIFICPSMTSCSKQLLLRKGSIQLVLLLRNVLNIGFQPFSYYNRPINYSVSSLQLFNPSPTTNFKVFDAFSFLLSEGHWLRYGKGKNQWIFRY